MVPKTQATTPSDVKILDSEWLLISVSPKSLGYFIQVHYTLTEGNLRSFYLPLLDWFEIFEVSIYW